MIAAIIMIVFPFAMIYSAFSDALTMTIANRVSLVLIGGFLVVAPFIGLTWIDFAWHLAAFALVLTVTFGLFATGTMGGGDAKLLASTSLWMGMTPALATYLLAVSILGGVVTLVLLKFRGTVLATYLSGIPEMRYLVCERDIPYGIALGIGGLLAFMDSPAMIWVFNQLAV